MVFAQMPVVRSDADVSSLAWANRREAQPLRLRCSFATKAALAQARTGCLSASARGPRWPASRLRRVHVPRGKASRSERGARVRVRCCDAAQARATTRVLWACTLSGEAAPL
jgi:hypothetical protein